MTDQKTPESPQERLEGVSATPAPPEGQNGPQTGADGFQGEQRPHGPVDWARQQAAERGEQQATGRPTASTITQQQLDALYADLDAAEAEARAWATAESADAAAGSYAGRVEELQAVLARVRRLIEQHSVAVGTHLLEEALDEPAHNAGPSVRECADQDRAY